MRICVGALLTLTLLANDGPLALAQGVSSSAASFERVRRLNDLAARRLSPQPEQVVRLISEGLADSDPKVQRSALWALASRASGIRFSESAELRQQWNAERPLLDSLRLRVTALIESPDSRVRHAVLVALASLDYKPGDERRRLNLSDQVTALLVSRYPSEPNSLVRSEIVKALALDPRAKSGESVLIRALSDPDRFTVQFAVMGIVEHGMVNQIPRLMELLEHEAHEVRIAAAAALGRFGEKARTALRSLQLALSIESHVVARDTMTAAIRAVQGGR